MTDNLQPWTQWIGTETIATFYAEGIRRWGGAASDPKPGCIDAALGSAYNAELYSPESEEEGFIQGLVFAGRHSAAALGKIRALDAPSPARHHHPRTAHQADRSRIGARRRGAPYLP